MKYQWKVEVHSRYFRMCNYQDSVNNWIGMEEHREYFRLTSSLLVGIVGGLWYHFPIQEMCLEERIIDHKFNFGFITLKCPVLSGINWYTSLYFILPQLFKGCVWCLGFMSFSRPFEGDAPNTAFQSNLVVMTVMRIKPAHNNCVK